MRKPLALFAPPPFPLEEKGGLLGCFYETVQHSTQEIECCIPSSSTCFQLLDSDDANGNFLASSPASRRRCEGVSRVDGRWPN